ncbi:MAG: cysteine--tRNA ligase [Boseongicola sp. SB0675_bin_26]|nr:cysteine--tRNA ligase [Boseongicola sp. SB0675_bin_26]
MTNIQLHDTATRTKRPLEPLVKNGHPTMYVCGPTVYDRAHIGNARPVIVFDMLFRLLRHVYGPDRVTYVRNFTDVDDKINARATAEKRPIREITEETTRWYLDDMAAIGALVPDAMPRATEWIEEMVEMIVALIERGHAYAAESHVLFRVRSCPGYGDLSGRSVDDMIAGARVEVAPFKEDPMDFVLWKPSDEQTPGWDSPWGRGRPGWHIECSAMAAGLLGERFDIHGGGNDLVFPHHENEIAQSRCLGHEFARLWMHNEMLLVEGKKMAKSLGNFFTLRDLLDGNWSGGWNVPGEVIRFVFLSTHYRRPMDWTEDRAREAEATLRKWYAMVETLASGSWRNADISFLVKALSDDLNTHEALASLHRFAAGEDVAALAAGLEFLGLMTDRVPDWAREAVPSEDVSDLVNALLSERATAKAAQDFVRADSLREGLTKAGIVINDTSVGVNWHIGPSFDQDKLEALK